MAKTKEEKLREKQLAKAAKLKPRPILLQSGKWRCQVMADGKRVSITANTPEEANALALAKKAGLIEQAKEDDMARAGNITLTAAIDKYIEARKNVLSPSTISGYKEIQRNRFPDLMHTKVSRIGPESLQEAVNSEAKKVSAKTLKNAVGLVVAVVSQYHELNTKRIRLPQRKKKEHAFLDEQGLINLFDAIRGDLVELPLLLGIWLGMRRSEIMGLCWDCVDFNNFQIHVRRTYVKGEDGYILRDELKTEASRRTLDCPGYIMEKLKVYTPNHREGRVFTMHPNTLYKNMKKCCEEYGINFVGVHGLRHTNATVMLSLGVIDKVAMARGGWSTDITMRQIYQHVFNSDKEKAGNMVDTFFQNIANGVIVKESAPSQ